MMRLRIPELRYAFTLVETLAVVAILVILLGLGAVGFRTYGNATARRNAVGQLMGEISNARALAMNHGGGIYLAFAGGSAPDRFAYRAYAIFLNDGTGGGLTPLTDWTSLPDGILLKSEEGSLMDESGAVRPPFFPFPQNDTPLPCPYLAFDASGAVTSPADPNRLRIVLCEGVRIDGEEVVTTRNSSVGKPPTDEIVISRLTGLARHPET